MRGQPGEVFTMVPRGTSEERLKQFHCGGLIPANLERAGAVTLADGSTLVPVVSLIEQQVTLLHDAMRTAPGAVCIVDDVNPRWSDRSEFARGPTAFGVGEEVYHLLTADCDRAVFVNVINAADAIWHGVAAVCRSAPSLGPSSAVSAAELEQCAASAVLFTCAAYDGEGFVAWRRGSVASQ